MLLWEFSTIDRVVLMEMFEFDYRVNHRSGDADVEIRSSAGICSSVKCTEIFEQKVQTQKKFKVLYISTFGFSMNKINFKIVTMILILP